MFDIFPIEGGVCAPEGFYADGVDAGLKSNNALDLAFIHSKELLQVSALFTQNRFQAAPIKHFLSKPKGFKTNFILINAKNANALTGKDGVLDVEEILATLEAKYPSLKNPIMSSTGVIGVRIPKEKICSAFGKFNLDNKNSTNAAKAIMTTDAFKKEIALKIKLDSGGLFHIGGVAKGAGMINPALATMLCFITTDADVPEGEGEEILKELMDYSFNAISVDGDMSTNDSVIMLSNRKSNAYSKEAFKEGLKIVLHKLATDIARDGEGAKKLVAFSVIGAKDNNEAKRCAKALSNSLLVKTAIFGEDPNWGRVASTIGASGVECSEDSLKISFDDILVYDRGDLLFDKELEKRASMVLKRDSFKILCDLGVGEGSFTAYGCDLGYEYVKINADYRT